MSDLDIIKEIEAEIGQKLEKLEYYDSYWKGDHSFFDIKGKVNLLALDELEIKTIPLPVFKLHNLTALHFNNNQLTVLPIEIGELKNLQTLNLSSNQLTILPEVIGELKNLQKLNLNSNRLTTLPEIIGELKNLQKLDLHSNKLTTLPEIIGALKNLQKLDLHSNKLTTLPEVIGELKKLPELNLSYNKLAAIPEGIGELKNLQKLDLHSNILTTLPEIIGELKNLQTLNLHANKLTTLPEVMGELKNLQYLELGSNQLTVIPEGIGELKHLLELDLRYNKLTGIPDWILQTRLDISWEYRYGHTGIYLDGNPLESPPVEIVKKGHDAVVEWFKSLEVGEKRALNEVKVLVVGDGAAGKTSLVKRILREEYDPNEPQTHGININPWEIEDGKEKIKVRFWDFGGQQVMHATHQFFMSKRCLYVLLLNARQGANVEYWIKQVESFGGDSPILVVINKIDENPGFDVDRLPLSDKYQSIKGFYRVSCADNKGIKVFKRNLTRELKNVEMRKTTWAESWFNVKTRLEDMEENYISYEKYADICEKAKVDTKGAQDTLIGFLHDLGIILHFPDFELFDTHVLEPRWVTEGVYKIINSPELAKGKGVLKLNLLDKILEKKDKDDFFYPKNKYKYIIDLMKKFELCYDIDKKTILVPDLLEAKQPKFSFKYENSLRFLIDYNFLPKSIMPRFIVKMHKDIKGSKKLQWRTGVVLEDKIFKTTAVVRADEKEKKIYIFVNGLQKRDYLAIILFNFRDIHSTFTKLEAIEKAPLPDNPKVTISYKHLLNLENLEVEEYIPDGTTKKYNVKELLKNIYKEIKSEDDLKQILIKLQDKLDINDTSHKKENKALLLQPNFYGVGVDIRALLSKIASLFRKWKIRK